MMFIIGPVPAGVICDSIVYLNAVLRIRFSRGCSYHTQLGSGYGRCPYANPAILIYNKLVSTVYLKSGQTTGGTGLVYVKRGVVGGVGPGRGYGGLVVAAQGVYGRNVINAGGGFRKNYVAAGGDGGVS